MVRIPLHLCPGDVHRLSSRQQSSGYLPDDVARRVVSRPAASTADRDYARQLRLFLHPQLSVRYCNGQLRYLGDNQNRQVVF